MNQLFTTKIGRLRILGYLEGITLLLLIFAAAPLKYYFQIPQLSQILGPIHGALFLLYIINTLSVGIEHNWEFKTTIWKIILACFVPFGTFYIDYKILKNIK